MTIKTMTIEERVDAICKWTNQGLRDLVLQAILEAMRDQRHACAEAINGVEDKYHTLGNYYCVRRNEVFQAVFNADARDVERANRNVKLDANAKD